MSNSAFWRTLPLVSFVVAEWHLWRADRTRPCYTLAPPARDAATLSPYPIDMWPLLSLPIGPLDEAGVLYYVSSTSDLPSGYYATAIAQYALAQWNAYLATDGEQHKHAFLVQAEWLVAHESRLANDASGWPFTVSLPDYHADAPWLSALTQGNCISVLARAFQLTKREVFLQVARRAVHTFELDIREGGVSAPLGNDGVFFEEVAAYPAAHILNGYLFSLFGLYDYVAQTGDSAVAALIERSLTTLHAIIDQYDAGYWSRYDLLHRKPASWFYHDQHSVLLIALSRYSGCSHCVRLAARWTGYQQSLLCRLCYVIMSRYTRYRNSLQRIGPRGALARLIKAGSQPIAKRVSYLNTTPPAVHTGSREEVH